MLPLDKLTSAAEKAFSDIGADTARLDLVLRMDLDLDGNFGETWLGCNTDDRKLYIISSSSDAEKIYRKKKAAEAGKTIDEFTLDRQAEFDLNIAKKLYVDNFVSSNRLLAILPDGEDDKTVCVAYCTNACKKKLFAFLDIIDRLKDGVKIDEDDPIFEQFNQKCPRCGKVYEDQNRKICKNCVKGGAIFIRLLKYFTEFKPQLITVLICMLCSSGLALLTPIVNGVVLYDNVVSPTGKYHSEAWVYIVVGVIFGMAMLSVLISIIQNRANARMSTRVSFRMKLNIFTSMQRLSLAYFNQNPTGRLINRVNYDADRIRSFFIDGVPHLIVNMLNFIGLTIFLFMMNWKLTLIVFIPVPIIVWIFKVMLPKLWRMYSRCWRRSSSLNAFLGDSLNGVRVVKAFAKEAEETHRFYKYSTNLYEANLRVNMVSLTIFPIIGLLIAISSNAIWGAGGLSVMNETMTYGEFTSYFGYLGMIFGPLNFFTNFTNLVTDTINSAQRMFEILDAVPDITDAPNPVDLETIKGDIELKRVCFHYAPNRPILKNVSLKINAGDNIGLVGHTGSGKSTIANLINRMYDVISGSIEIDGHNVKQIKISSLRKNIAIVSQEIFLFKGTIADNIRYARPDASMDDIIAAAKAANAHDFILNLPDGYETMVGTGSRSLSGGEKQRISIARALLLDPSILILDEATAAMDTETERLIQDALNNLVKGKTTITIAHRLSTLKECNYLFAIENGEIAEQGTHTELIAQKGVYYRLYTLQSEAMKKVLQGM